MTPLILLFGLAFLVSVDIRILTPVLPSISSSLGATPGVVGLAMTSYSFAYGAGQLFYGPLSDRMGRIAVVRVAGLGFSLCTVLSALAMTPWQFIAIRFVAGVFAGAVIPLALVYIGDTVEYGRRQDVLGQFFAVTSAAFAFSASIGGTVAHFVSWRVMLFGYAVLALIPVGLMWQIDAGEPTAMTEAPASPVQFWDFLCSGHAQAVYLAVFLEGFLVWGSATYLATFGTHRHGLDQFSMGLLIALLGAGTMASGLCMARVRRWLSENALAASGGGLMGAAFVLLIPRWSWPVLAASTFLLGLGYVALHTTLQLRGTEISSTARGKAFSLFVFSLFAGNATGTAAFGRLVDAGRYELAFAISAVGLVAVGLGTAIAGRYPKR